MNNHPDSSLTFQTALRQQMSKQGTSAGEVGRRVGASTGLVESWLNGSAIPSAFEFKKLVGSFRALRFFPPSRAPSSSTVWDESEEKSIPKPEPLPLPAQSISPSTFGEALQQERELEEISQTELGTLMKVTGQAVGAWESGINCPVKEHYQQLLSLFPRLEHAPEPDWKDIPPPNGGRGVEREALLYYAPSREGIMKEIDHLRTQPGGAAVVQEFAEHLPRDARRALGIKREEAPPPVMPEPPSNQPRAPNADISPETLVERIVSALEQLHEKGGMWCVAYCKAPNGNWVATVARDAQRETTLQGQGETPRDAGKALLRVIVADVEERTKDLRRQVEALEKMRKTLL